jgi:hypothetical protein
VLDLVQVPVTDILGIVAAADGAADTVAGIAGAAAPLAGLAP